MEDLLVYGIKTLSHYLYYTPAILQTIIIILNHFSFFAEEEEVEGATIYIDKS